MRFSIRTLLIIQLIVSLYFGLFYCCWQPHEVINVEVENRTLWLRDSQIFTSVKEDVLIVSYYYYIPKKCNIFGFPSVNEMQKWVLLKAYYNPPNDPIELYKLKSLAHTWLKTKEGQDKIKKAREWQ